MIWAKSNSGETGFFSTKVSGEMGRISAGLKVGDIYGPIKTADGYIIFKLIDKREIEDTTIENYDEVKSVLRGELGLKKLNSMINSRTVELAKMYKVKIFNKALESTEVLPTNTFTYRLIGFGGKITALPLTIPMYEWYEEWKGSGNDIP